MEDLSQIKQEIIDLDLLLETNDVDVEVKASMEILKKKVSEHEEVLIKLKNIHCERWFIIFNCSTIDELYIKIDEITRVKLGPNQLPFELSDFENPLRYIEIHDFMTKHFSDAYKVPFLNRNAHFIKEFGCSSFKELYKKVTSIAKDKMGLKKLPFSKPALINPSESEHYTDIQEFLFHCLKLSNGNNSDENAKKLIEFLKNNPPMVQYKNPKLNSEMITQDENNLMVHIFNEGIDLPGSKYNPFGHLQYFSSFFIDVFFGNYTEVMEYLDSLSEKELKMALERREGYLQLTPIFSAIAGLRLVSLENSTLYTSSEKCKIRLLYSGNNENKHLKIMKKLIELKADVNAHDRNGYTPLHYALYHSCKNEKMTIALLKNGADPNKKNLIGDSALTQVSKYDFIYEADLLQLECLLDHNAVLTNNKEHSNILRAKIEDKGSKKLAVKVRKACPREKFECEKCGVSNCTGSCGACGMFYYCSPACQKQDWKFHKIVCQKTKRS